MGVGKQPVKKISYERLQKREFILTILSAAGKLHKAKRPTEQVSLPGQCFLLQTHSHMLNLICVLKIYRAFLR